jgi:hypothetical protein
MTPDKKRISKKFDLKKYAGIDDAPQALFFALPFSCLYATLTLVGAAFVFCAERLGSASIDLVLMVGGARASLAVVALVVFAVVYGLLLIANRAAVIRVALLMLALLPTAPLLGALFILRTSGFAYHFCGI